MKKTIMRLARMLMKPRAAENAFDNIAEGTHATNITMRAASEISDRNLVVCAGSSEGEFAVCSATSKPIGVCTDEGDKDDILNVQLGGCPQGTMLCVAASEISAGQSVYTAAQGHVSAIAADGSYKIGVAVAGAASGGLVEIDPQGFGQRAWQIVSGGIYLWQGSTASATMTCPTVLATDIVFASLNDATATSVKASTTAGSVTFALNSNGTSNTTKIAWIILRKN